MRQIASLRQEAFSLYDQAEDPGSARSMDFVIKGNALRNKASEKEKDLKGVETDIGKKEEELRNIL